MPHSVPTTSGCSSRVCVCVCVRWRATWSSSLLATQIECDKESSRGERGTTWGRLHPHSAPGALQCATLLTPFAGCTLQVVGHPLCPVWRHQADAFAAFSQVWQRCQTHIHSGLAVRCFTLLKKFLISLGASRRVTCHMPHAT